MIIRCSSLPRIRACPASLKECEGLPRIGSAASVAGTAKHEAVKRLAETGEPLSEREVASIAARFDVEEREIADWCETVDFVRNAKSKGEVLIEADQVMDMGRDAVRRIDMMLAGRPDLLIRVGSIIEIYDWKSGRSEVDPARRNAQMIGYATLAWSYFGGCQEVSEVRVHIYQPLVRGWDSAAFDDLGNLTEMVSSWIGDAVAETPEYRPGEVCRWCPARSKCPALINALPANFDWGPVPGDVDAMRPLAELSPAEQGRAIEQLTAMADISAAWLAEAKRQLKMIVEERGQPIPLPSGKVWGPVPVNKKTVELNHSAWYALQDLCGPHFIEAIKTSKDALFDAAMTQYESANAGDASALKRGYKKKVKGRVFKALSETGALIEREETHWKAHHDTKRIED